LEAHGWADSLLVATGSLKDAKARRQRPDPQMQLLEELNCLKDDDDDDDDDIQGMEGTLGEVASWLGVLHNMRRKFANAINIQYHPTRHSSLATSAIYRQTSPRAPASDFEV